MEITTFQIIGFIIIFVIMVVYVLRTQYVQYNKGRNEILEELFKDNMISKTTYMYYKKKINQ